MMEIQDPNITLVKYGTIFLCARVDVRMYAYPERRVRRMQSVRTSAPR